MRPLRYSISVTLDGCCDHRVIIPDEELHRHGAAYQDMHGNDTRRGRSRCGVGASDFSGRRIFG